MTVSVGSARPDAPQRVYVALTNRCNYACPSCSTESGPDRTAFFPPEALVACLPATGNFDVQLEGGEPTLHPDFDEIIVTVRRHPRLGRLSVCTNGALLPSEPGALRLWIERLGEPSTLKLTVTPFLLKGDVHLMERALRARDIVQALGGDRRLVLDVRVGSAPGAGRGDEQMLRAVEESGLRECANIRTIRRGPTLSHTDETELLPPGVSVTLVNPDGRIFGREFDERTDAIRALE